MTYSSLLTSAKIIAGAVNLCITRERSEGNVLNDLSFLFGSRFGPGRNIFVRKNKTKHTMSGFARCFNSLNNRFAWRNRCSFVRAGLLLITHGLYRMTSIQNRVDRAIAYLEISGNYLMKFPNAHR